MARGKQRHAPCCQHSASRGVGTQVKAEICQSPRWICNASRMGSNYSGPNLQGGKWYPEL